MRFLTVSPYRAGHGAYERQRRMAQALVAAGHEVIWLAPATDFPGGERLVVVEDGFAWAPGPLRWMLRVRRCLGRLGDVGVDAVFSVSEYDTLGMLLDARTARLPHLFFQRGDTIACEAFHARHAITWRRRLKSAVLLSWYPVLQRLAMRRVAGIVVQADFLRDGLRARVPGLPCPIAVLPNDCRFDWHPEPADDAVTARLAALRDGGLLIGFVAQAFWRGKGFDVFFQAMAKLAAEPGIRAVIIGYGEDEALISATIDRLGLRDRVVSFGRVGAAQALMPLFDLVVVPTQFPDACPNVVMEAMDAGTMILASDIPAHQAQLGDGPLLVPAGDADALAQGILRLRDNSTARDANRAMVAARRAVFRFDWDARVVEIVERHARGRLAEVVDG
jgi:glycosyltransferase involved in cell wall biosynthesis